MELPTEIWGEIVELSKETNADRLKNITTTTQISKHITDFREAVRVKEMEIYGKIKAPYKLGDILKIQTHEINAYKTSRKELHLLTFNDVKKLSPDKMVFEYYAVIIDMNNKNNTQPNCCIITAILTPRIRKKLINNPDYGLTEKYVKYHQFNLCINMDTHDENYKIEILQKNY